MFLMAIVRLPARSEAGAEEAEGCWVGGKSESIAVGKITTGQHDAPESA